MTAPDPRSIMRLFARSRPDWRQMFTKTWADTLARADCDLDAVALEAIRDDVSARMEVWEKSADGLMLLRTELMDSVDRTLVHRAFLTLDPMVAGAVRKTMPDLPADSTAIERLIAANELRITVIRAWAGVRYGDLARNDWFDTYRQAANMREAGAVRDLERIAGDVPAAVRNNLDAAIKGLNSSLRLRLAQTPPGIKIGQRSKLDRLRALFHRRSRQRAGQSGTRISGLGPPSS